MAPVDEVQAPVFHPHVYDRMYEKGIPEEAIYHVLGNYHTKRPAPRGRARPADIYVGDYMGRNLKVYVARDTNPPLVTTVAWQGD
jgi:hypothetical protein